MVYDMGLIQLYSTPKTNSKTNGISMRSRCHDDNAAFCRCSLKADSQRKLNEKTKQKCHSTSSKSNDVNITNGHLDISTYDRNPLLCSAMAQTQMCRCGEDTCQTINWTWDKQVQPQTFIDEQMVLFHPIYSQGTSVVRSNRPLTPHQIHYWEIKIVKWISGTDLMVGIGTDAINLLEYRYKFASVLGLDSRSWGYSHRGMTQHKNVLKYYGKTYTMRSIVGVYLDLSRGHLEFYVNRIPQGIAFRNIPLNEHLYAMVCSTSAKSSVRLINTTSFPDSLQFRCMKIITKYPQLLDKVQRIPGLANLCRNVWFMFPKERYQYSKDNDNQHENNPDAIMLSEQNDDDIIPGDDLNHAIDVNDVNDDCENSAGSSLTSTFEHENIDEVIFLSTFDDSQLIAQQSDDDDPVYDDGD